ncbi:nucleotidyltransferase domain-containing protein [Marinobacter sp. 1-3A]|uniref:nucleotidyltransferase domain-containing protein n=1 Tax=Marinobacter sp. 1-3A TaxID=2582920 RepID=UPI0019031B6E|nr:nucleotidyltransferase domain-containing protein [Marinobacter sp. 1-3A]MBK1872197.1 nucleotidyltransferase domain-containing protein [Marinobacter sp. 1-3A]
MYKRVLTDYPALLEASEYTKQQLNKIRSALSSELQDSPHKEQITIVTVGSYGRGEASESSDLDLYILFNSDRDAEDVIADELIRIKRVLDGLVPNETGSTGTFGANVCVRFADIQSNIGGKDDTNADITRRLLFLLEGTWLYGKERFRSYRLDLLARYIKPNGSDGKLARFLLNDIIRYYRTIATDFEHKVSDQKQEWGLRQVKLRFSRKILYFSGIVAVAETADLPQQQTLEKINDWFDYQGLERIYQAAPALKETRQVLELYEHFLAQISDRKIRQNLEQLNKEDRASCQPYCELREKGVELSNVLTGWLKEQYSPEHQIHQALLF